jgi:hypothetical protein
MPALLIRQRVVDYTRWRHVFDGRAHARTANGCQEVRVYRTPADPHDTVIVLTWDTLVRARLFAQSDDLLESLDQSGVNRPDILLLDDAS